MDWAAQVQAPDALEETRTGREGGMNDILTRLKELAALANAVKAQSKWYTAEELQERRAMAAEDAALIAALAPKVVTDIIQAVEAMGEKIAKYQARLEIDHAFKLVDGELVRYEIPDDERDRFPDLVTCQAATIELIEDHVAELKAEVDEARKFAAFVTRWINDKKISDFERQSVIGNHPFLSRSKADQ